jgi:hypothetical protein
MKKNMPFILLLLLVLSIETTFGQEKPKSKFWELGVGYWGTLNHNYGAKVGIGKVIPFSEKYSLHSGLSIIVNRKSDIYMSAGVTIDNFIRRTFKWGGYWEHGINVGYLGSIYDFDLYRTNSQGQINNVGKKWLSSAIFGYSFGIGYDFSKKTKTDFQFFFRPGLYFRFPNFENSFYINNYSIEAGVIWKPKFMAKKQQKPQ